VFETDILCVFVTDDTQVNPISKVVNEGENHLIECFSGEETTWIFTDMNDNQEWPDNAEVLENQLVISSVTLMNQGIYECSGTYENGSRFSAASSMLVKG